MTSPPSPRTAPSEAPGVVAPRARQRESGAATTELVIVMPLLLLLVLASVHVGLWFHANHLVDAAAHEGARAARAMGGTDDDGYQRANQMLRDLGSGSVTDPTVTVTRNAGSVTVSVTGQSPPVIPGLTMAVSASTTSPIETFTP
jgi:Flp pilus assembly protein TadG